MWFRRARLSFLNFPIPCRLPYGGWWLAHGDLMGLDVFWGGARYEQAERQFVCRLLKPGMTVFDIGANQGFYTILAAKKTQPGGKVFAFEPVPCEFEKLRWNLKINRCRNVVLEPLALGSQDGFADIHIRLDGFGPLSSLRPPAEDAKARRQLTHVEVSRLDTFVRQANIHSIDFMKIDVEGGELKVLKGGLNVLSRMRPTIMCEVAEIGTRQ